MDCNYGITWEEIKNEYICEEANTNETWTVIPEEFICDNGNKYYKEKLQYCTDDGLCFDSEPLQTRKGTMYEANSTDCK